MAEASVRTLMENVRTPSRDGYAALVFIASRAEGDGVVHRQHLRDWPGIHDLTSRHVAVITPDPGSVAVLDRGVAIRGCALFGAGRASVADAGSWRPAAYAPRLPRPLADHATAVTTVATQLQEYFGLTEAILPCAVIVCTREREVVVVGLSRRVTLYGLLKQVKSELEPALARLNRARAELAAHDKAMAPLDAERARAQAALSAARQRAATWRAAVVARRDWAGRRAQLAGELRDLAADVDANTAAQFRWLAERLADDRALGTDEATRAEALYTALSSRVGTLSSRERRSLLRRTRGVVAVLGKNGAVRPAKPDDDIGRLEEELSRSQAACDAESPVRDALAAKVVAAACLDMLGAVRSAVDRLGLAESPSALQWGETTWRVTAFVPPPRRTPSVRTARG
ncbi:hypothetical protein [Amycolatopsis sp.]|uniref:hypothetical protein n=1 Tax=Amycolatopsis sp. TaxID=37632 RepID=UPI002D7ED08E|nr:hypothetical protein [Amycolatopsis sp.]HET6707088.1 hypothetical protein [Amycolatopsis sp.]